MIYDDWTEDQREALERWRNKDPEERHPHDLIPGTDVRSSNSPGSNEVTDEECARMRSLFKSSDDVTIRELSQDEFSYSRETISRHVFDRDDCNHIIDEDPVEDTGDRTTSDEFVKASECADMRQEYHSGTKVVDIAEDSEYSYDQTYYHIIGRCKCDNSVDPSVPGSKE